MLTKEAKSALFNLGAEKAGRLLVNAWAAEQSGFQGRLTRAGLALPEEVVSWIGCKNVDVEVDLVAEEIRIRPGHSYTLTVRAPSKQGILRSEKVTQMLAVIGIGVGDRLIFVLEDDCVGTKIEPKTEPKTAILMLGDAFL